MGTTRYQLHICRLNAAYEGWLIRAVLRLVVYDSGFSCEFGTWSVLWSTTDIDKKVQYSVNSTLIASNLYKKRMSGLDKIESMHPGYLHFFILTYNPYKRSKRNLERDWWSD